MADRKPGRPLATPEGFKSRTEFEQYVLDQWNHYDWTKKALAENCGVSIPTINKVLANVRP